MAGTLRVRRDDLVAMGVGAGVFLAYWFHRLGQVSSSVQPVGGDLMFQFVPDYTYLAERLRAGELPRWNPYQGQPFLAMMIPAVLYPARLLLLAFDVPTAMHLSTLAHLLLSGGATYALCRSLGATPLGALAGGAVFVGVYALPIVYTPIFLEGGTWLPVAALAFVRLAATGAWRWAVLLGSALGLIVLAGCYQHALYALYGLVFLGVAMLVDRERRGHLATPPVVLMLSSAAVLAIATAAPQALPTLLWSAETVRSGVPLTDAQIDPYPFPDRALRNLFVPPTAFADSYVSIPVMALAVAGSLGAGRFGGVLLVSIVLTTLLSLGRGTPAFALFHVLPGLASFRTPQRFVFVVAFLTAMAVALGTSRLARVGRYGAGCAILAALVVAWTLFSPPRLPAALPWTVPSETLAGPKALFDAVAQVTKGGRTLLPGEAFGDGIAIKQGAMHHVLGVQDYNSLSSVRLATHLRATVGEPPPRSDDPELFLGWIKFVRPIVRPELLDVLAVRSLLVRSSATIPDREPPFRPIMGHGRWTLYDNPAALPRAFVVGRAKVVPDESQALDAMHPPAFDPRREVVLVGDPSESDPLATANRGPEPFHEVALARDEPERIVADVEVERPAVLVVTDAFAPGWRATIDGRAVPLRQANHLARGVVVAAGRSRVELTYEAPGLAPGIALAGLGWGVAGLVAIHRWRHRHARTAAGGPDRGRGGRRRSARRPGRARHRPSACPT
jgi:hypothetical protein